MKWDVNRTHLHCQYKAADGNWVRPLCLAADAFVPGHLIQITTMANRIFSAGNYSLCLEYPHGIYQSKWQKHICDAVVKLVLWHHMTQSITTKWWDNLNWLLDNMGWKYMLNKNLRMGDIWNPPITLWLHNETHPRKSHFWYCASLCRQGDNWNLLHVKGPYYVVVQSSQMKRELIVLSSSA